MAAELKALDIYRLLPGTSCKRCGELTCLAFAVKLVGGEIEITKCSPLFSEKYQEKRIVLLELLNATGHSISSIALENGMR
jgi:ArsR family metal-binding transcriptional regulator